MQSLSSALLYREWQNKHLMKPSAIPVLSRDSSFFRSVCYSRRLRVTPAMT